MLSIYPFLLATLVASVHDLSFPFDGSSPGFFGLWTASLSCTIWCPWNGNVCVPGVIRPQYMPQSFAPSLLDDNAYLFHFGPSSSSFVNLCDQYIFNILLRFLCINVSTMFSSFLFIFQVSVPYVYRWTIRMLELNKRKFCSYWYLVADLYGS